MLTFFLFHHFSAFMAGNPTHWQLRAARSMLGKTQAWLAKEAKITPAVLLGLESPNRKLPDNHALARVSTVLEAEGLELIEAMGTHGEGVRWREPSGRAWVAGLRHARAMLGVSLDEMAELSEVGRDAIARIERGGLRRTPEQSALKLRDALLSNGVIIVPEGREHGLGIFLFSQDK
ncbi:hypothetical protein ASD36_15085 [Rhizobium sp. Root1334]|nr:hypothetical protein ASD36_15085 [Rhizobium sp. Root1334]